MTPTLKKLLIIKLLLISLALHSQSNKQDSIAVNKYNYYKLIDKDSTLHYINILKKSNDRCIKFTGQIAHANFAYREGKFQSSEDEIISLLKEIKGSTTGDRCLDKIMINAYSRLFWIYKNRYQLLKAFEATKKIENEILSNTSLSSSNKQRLFLSNKANMANLKIELGLYKEAIKILKEVDLEISKLIPKLKNEKLYNSLIFKSSTLNLIGNSFLEQSKNENDISLDSAQAYYNKAYEVTKSFSPQHQNSHALYELRSIKVLLKQKRYKQALRIIKGQAVASEEINVKQDLNFLKAITFYNLNELDSSKSYSYKFLKFKKQTPNTEKNKIVILNILGEIYKNSHQMDSAYKYSDLAINEFNTLNKNRSEANNSHYLYDFERVQELNDELLTKENAKRNLVIFILSSVIILFIVFIIRFYRKGKKFTEAFTVSKKEYSIDKSLEKKILSELTNFEKSTLYLDQEFNIKVLAKHFKTNTTYLSSIVNEKKGKTFKQYIGELRINFLIQKLKSDTMLRKYTVQALAEEIGYSNASAFARAFKKQTGKTPTEFLKELNN